MTISMLKQASSKAWLSTKLWLLERKKTLWLKLLTQFTQTMSQANKACPSQVFFVKHRNAELATDLG